MRIVIAQMKHETNTFSPVPTPLARFARAGDMPLAGGEAIAEYRGTGSAIGAFIELAEQSQAEIVLPIAANAPPSGPVDQTAYELIAQRICAAVADGCDAVLLDLHGAMVTERFDDGEGELLRRLREIAPKVPIGVALDMHTNLFGAMVEHADVLAGYQTYPHVDMHGTGLRAGRAILAMLRGQARPTVAWGNRRMLPHVMRQSSLDAPNRAIQARARAIEREGALAATVFVGFPHADIENAGLSAVVVTDADPVQARRWCDELLDMAWHARADFVYRPEPLQASMARARELAAHTQGAPVVLLDHYDNCASGGTMDTMAVLGAMLEAGLENAAAFAVFDPDAVQAMTAAGEGAELTLDLGGKTDMPALGLRGEPRRVTGTVRRLSDGEFRIEGPMARGERASMGPCAVLEVGGIEIAVISRHVEPFDIGALKTVGIDPRCKRFLMLKSRVHWRAGLGAYAGAVVECAGVGVCTSDYATLRFERVRRPIFPLELDAPPV
ncbi:MAG: M81 family metallopeptidase [Burkholderiales bacterium]|nr:MAG: M81 family metallopeptidase [Burkholderiales bacterium]